MTMQRETKALPSGITVINTRIKPVFVHQWGSGSEYEDPKIYGDYPVNLLADGTIALPNLGLSLPYGKGDFWLETDRHGGVRLPEYRGRRAPGGLWTAWMSYWREAFYGDEGYVQIFNSQTGRFLFLAEDVETYGSMIIARLNILHGSHSQARVYPLNRVTLGNGDMWRICRLI